MATINDIDTKASVGKFLTRTVVLSKNSESEDSADEIQAILESSAIAFLLNPQAALFFILLAKNTLQQISQKDLELVDFMIAAVNEVTNPDTFISDTSDLIEAQTALVELDKVGTVSTGSQSFVRYNASIGRFLNQQLATSLKRNSKNEFERSGQEAKQDLFSALNTFKSTHGVMIDYINDISKAVADFRSVDLARIVAGKTVSRVRSSLRKVSQGMSQGTLSKTVAAVELLSGSAALASISQKKDVYDPDVQTGSFPQGRTITFDSEIALASILSNDGPFSLPSPWKISLAVDELAGGLPVITTLPKTGHTGEPFVISSKASAVSTYTLPSGPKKLYLYFAGAPTPYVEVDLSSLGTSVSFATIATAINSVLSSGSPDFLGSCVELAPKTNRFLITATTSIVVATKVTVLEHGVGSIVSGSFVPSAPSVHTNLGFFANQSSEDIGTISPSILADLIQVNYPNTTVTVEDTKVKISSNLSSIRSSLTIDQLNTSNFGFPSGLTQSSPSSIILKEGSTEVSPGSLGILVGSMVSAADQVDPSITLFSPIADINGNNISFADGVTVPRAVSGSLTITSPMVFFAQNITTILSSFITTFDSDILTLQRVLSPLLSIPTLAQINDAKRALNALRSNLSNNSNTGLIDILIGVVVTENQTPLSTIANTILSGLEERGLDRATDLLKKVSFSGFFALSKEAASKSGRFLKAIEDVGSTDFSTTTIEDRIDDNKPVGTVPDDVLEGQQTSGDING